MTIDEASHERIYSYGGIALPGFPNLFMLYGPFGPVNNVPVPLGLEQEIGFIMRLVAEARARSAAVAPTAAATERFLARLGAAFPGTVWVGGCKNWYTGDQGRPLLWPLPQSEHKAFFDRAPAEVSNSSRADGETDLRAYPAPVSLAARCPRSSLTVEAR